MQNYILYRNKYFKQDIELKMTLYKWGMNLYLQYIKWKERAFGGQEQTVIDKEYDFCISAEEQMERRLN